VLELAYQGITISVNEKTPVLLLFSDGESIPLVFESWQQVSDTSVEFSFSNEVTVRITNTEADRTVFFTVSLPENAASLSLSLKPAKDYSIVEQTSSRTIFGSKTDMFVLNAPRRDGDTDTDALIIYADAAAVSYRPVNPESSLSFEAVSELELAGGDAYRATITSISERLVSAYESAPQEADEQATIAYIAAMSSYGRGTQALSRVPAAFRNSTTRTYLSTPYFNSLVQGNRGITAENTALASSLDAAIRNKDIDFFKTRDLGEYLIREQRSAQVNAFLQLPANSNFKTTQAAGIISVYSTLYPVRPTEAALLEPVIDACLTTIADSASLDGGRITISEERQPLDTAASVEIGTALISYGQVAQSPVHINVGQLIINSSCGAQISEFDLATLAELYRQLSKNNPAYPRYLLLSDSPDTPVWAWTIATSISYQRDAAGAITLGIDYAPGETHHVIIHGIPDFRGIQIYGVAYRSDPRFETYNSSGYVYDEATQTLLIKSVHRSRVETVRLTY
jgi:hypothetical protein